MVAALPSKKRNARSSSGRTGRGTTCWFEVLAGSRIALPSGFRRRPGLLSILYRASAARLASDVRVPLPARLAPSRARFRARSDATPLGPRREGGSLARAPVRSAGSPRGFALVRTPLAPELALSQIAQIRHNPPRPRPDLDRQVTRAHREEVGLEEVASDRSAPLVVARPISGPLGPYRAR